MAKKKDRIGETSIASNGMIMTIIAYRRSDDLDVQFKDGALREHVAYKEFIYGKISHPHDQERRANLSKARIGETAVALNGMTMTIVAYKNARNIDVQFEDGVIRKGVAYGNFKRGVVRHPNEIERTANLNKARIGETTTATNGMKMTIIAYRGARDIDVQFEDGAVKKHVVYKRFKKGTIRHPKEQKRRDNLSKTRIGETSVATNGMKMTIIAYRGAGDIDVQFEDSIVRKNVAYHEFKIGQIRHPEEQERLENLNNTRVGEINTNKNGMTMTIIAYRNAHDIDVQFEDGAIRKDVQYSSFKIGNITHPNELKTNLSHIRVGETSVATNGMKMTIIAYMSCTDIDVQFEDGAVRKHVVYQCFKKGNLRHPKEMNRIGETNIAKNGMKMTIIAYRSHNDIDVQFEDGKIVKNSTYYKFNKKINIQNSHFPMRGKGTYKTFETQYAYTTPDGSVYFYCECQKCGWKKNLTARELINLNHKCEDTKDGDV